MDSGLSFNEFKETDLSSNKKMLEYLLNLLAEKGYNVFIRNVSFLGFPAFHVIVPGLSEIEEIDDVKELEDYIQYNKIKRYIRSLYIRTSEEIDEIIEYFKHFNFNKEFSIIQLLNLPYKRMLPWYYANTDLFVTALLCKKGDFAEAYKSFGKYLESLKPGSCPSGLLTYYKCVRDYLGACMDNLGNADIIKLFSAFYPLTVIEGVIKDFGNPENILSSYGSLQCWDCNNCDLKHGCMYSHVENVYKALKDKYSSVKIT